MDGIREIARAYYARASEEERNSVKEFFKTLDADGDGKVSLEEFKASVRSWLCDDNLFKQLDENGDGTLDFDEALALHYIAKKIGIHKCDGCGDFLLGPYFSCTVCLGKANTYDLCCACFSKGEFQHKHPSSKMLDHHALLDLLGDRTKDARRKNAEEAIGATVDAGIKLADVLVNNSCCSIL